MNAGLVRRALHVSHAVAALALLATGLLLAAPDLRARLLGGYGREVAAWHDLGAYVFLGAPALALLLAVRPLYLDLRARLGPPDGLTWRKLHIAATLVLTALLSASGVVLWADAGLPASVYDASVEVHAAAAWMLAAALPLHLFAARRKIAARFRELLRGGSEDPFFELDEEP